MSTKTFLPGSDEQVKYLLGKVDITDKDVLIIGAGSHNIARVIAENGAANVSVIINDYESLLTVRMMLAGFENISIKMMEYTNTDFDKSQFDIVYAQASISNSERNKIVKEIKRILKPEGIFCVGEIVSLANEQPQFMKDIWENSLIEPLIKDEINGYYKSRNFAVDDSVDFSRSLKDFYSFGSKMLGEKSKELSEEEKSYYKKLINRISHESNAYLKLGGDKYMGFMILLLRKTA